MAIKIFALLCVVSLCAGCASAPAEPAANARGPTEAAAVAANAAGVTTVAAADDVDGGQVRCINEPVIGTRIPQRVCRTEAEWRQIREQSAEYLRAMQGPQVDPGEPGQ